MLLQEMVPKSFTPPCFLYRKMVSSFSSNSPPTISIKVFYSSPPHVIFLPTFHFVSQWGANVVILQGIFTTFAAIYFHVFSFDWQGRDLRCTVVSCCAIRQPRRGGYLYPRTLAHVHGINGNETFHTSKRSPGENHYRSMQLIVTAL